MPAKTTREPKANLSFWKNITRKFSPKREVSIYQATELLNAILPPPNATTPPVPPPRISSSTTSRPSISSILATIDEGGDEKPPSHIVSSNEEVRRLPTTAALSRIGPYDNYLPGLVYLQNTQVVGSLIEATGIELPRDLRVARLHDKNPAPVGTEGRLVVLKMFVAQEPGSKSTGREDMMMAATAHPNGHPNVVAYFGNTHFAPNSGTPVARWMVMEYVPCGTLFAMITEAGTEQTEKQTTTILPKHLCRQLLGDVLQGLHFLHLEKNIVHGDMKADNVLVKHRGDLGSIRAVISDFGLSRYCSSVASKTSSDYITSDTVRSRGSHPCLSVETLNWSIRLPDMKPINPAIMSAPEPSAPGAKTVTPECISKEKPCDIWAFAVLVLHVISYSIAWAGVGADPLKLTMHLTAGSRPPFPGNQTIARGLDFANWRVIWECWAALPRHRPTIQTLHRMWNPEQPEYPVALRLLSPNDSFGGWPDLTAEITSPLRKASTTSSRGNYIVTSGMLWRPAEIGDHFVNVQLIRRDGPLDSEGWTEDFKTELAKCRQVRHQRLHAPIGIGRIKESGPWFAVFASVDDYSDWLAGMHQREKKDGSIIIILSVLGMISEITKTIEYLHVQEPPIVHGDIVLSNVMFPPSDNDLVKVSSPEEPNALLGGFLNMRLASRQVESQREELAADICALTYLIRQVIDPLIDELKVSHQHAGHLLDDLSAYYDDVVSDNKDGSATAILLSLVFLTQKVTEVLDCPAS